MSSAAKENKNKQNIDKGIKHLNIFCYFPGVLFIIKAGYFLNVKQTGTHTGSCHVKTKLNKQTVDSL